MSQAMEKSRNLYVIPSIFTRVSHSTLTGALVALGSNSPYDETTVVAVSDTVVGVLVEVVVPEHLL